MQRSTQTLAEAPPQWALPVKQARSERTRDRLLAIGTQALELGSFDRTPIAALAAAAGCSVGAFYARFPDKEAFYRAVMAQLDEQMLARMERELAPERLAGLDVARTVDACLDTLLGMFRDHLGLVRTVQCRGHADHEAIVPLQRLGQALIDRMVERVGQSRARATDPAFERHAGAGFQIAISMILNSLLNQPPRLHPQGEDFRFWLREVVLHALHVAERPAPERPPPRRQAAIA